MLEINNISITRLGHRPNKVSLARKADSRNFEVLEKIKNDVDHFGDAIALGKALCDLEVEDLSPVILRWFAILRSCKCSGKFTNLVLAVVNFSEQLLKTSLM